jgi:hypothetical protein
VKLGEEPEPATAETVMCAWCERSFAGILELLTHVEDRHLAALTAA